MREARRFRRNPPPTVTLDGGRITADRRAVDQLRRLGLDTLQGVLAFDGGEVVRVAGTRTTRRIETDSAPLYLKVHGAAGRPWPLRGPSPARREWWNLQRLARDGFDSPEPLAMGETRPGARSERSFLLTRAVAGRPLSELLSGGWPEQAERSPAQVRNRVVRDLAGMVRRFHDSGYFHRDLYLAHLIVSPDPRWGRPHLIDLERVERRFPPRRRWLVKDLAALEHSAPSWVTRADRLRFLLRYLGKTRLDDDARRWLSEVRAKEQRMARHAPKFP